MEELSQRGHCRRSFFCCSVHRLSVVFRIRIAYSNSTGQPGCNTKNNLTVENRIQNRIVLKLNSNSAP